MPTSRRRVLAAVAATASLAGCIGDDGPETVAGPTDTGTPAPTGTQTPTDTPTSADAAMGATVQLKSHPDHGEILVGPEEMTLYMFDSDSQGAAESTCYDDCADAWPPLTVDGEPSAGDGVTAALTTFERDDGELQVAADGWPLYYYAPDEEPGDATGQGVGDVWWVLRPDGAPVRSDTPTPSPTDADAGDGGDPGDGY